MTWARARIWVSLVKERKRHKEKNLEKQHKARK
jgi:hypothetical protein